MGKIKTGIYLYGGHYWISYFADHTKVKFKMYGEPFHQLELNYFQLQGIKEVSEEQDLISLVLYKYRDGEDS